MRTLHMGDTAYTGADLFVDALNEYGVQYVFGNPGTTELPILRALEDAQVEYVLGLHEDIAIGMASGYASTRRYHSHHDPSINPVGVANLHAAPGLAHGLSNIQNAAWAGAPLVVTAGDHSTELRHEEPILSGDLERMAEESCKWSDEVLNISALPTLLKRAFRRALTPPTGPVFLGLPMDVMMEETSEDPEPLGPIPSAGPGDPTQIDAATAAIEAAEEPLLVVGDQVARSGINAINAATDLATGAGMGVYGEMITCEISFPHDHEQWISVVPPTPKIAKKLFDTDTILFVGCSTNTPYKPYDERFIPEETTSIHVHEDPDEIGKNHVVDIGIVGDPGEVMSRLAESVSISNGERRRRQKLINERRKRSRELVHVDRVDQGNEHISKSALADVIRETAPDALVVNESLTAKYPLITRWEFEPEQLLANKNGGLGYGLPAAVGAALAEEEADSGLSVVGFIGDGSYHYYPQTVYTAVRNELDLTIVIPNNANYRILKDGMIEIFGGNDDQYDFVGMDFKPPIDIAKNAQSYGAHAESVDDLATLRSVLERSVASSGPSIVDVEVYD